MSTLLKTALALALVSLLFALGALGINSDFGLANKDMEEAPWYLQTLVMLSYAVLGMAAYVVARSAASKPLGRVVGISVLVVMVLVPSIWVSAFFAGYAWLWLALLGVMAMLKDFSPIKRVVFIAAAFWLAFWLVFLMRYPNLSRMTNSLMVDPPSLMQWGMISLAALVIVWLGWKSNLAAGVEKFVALVFLIMLLASALASYGLFPSIWGSVSVHALPAMLLAMVLCTVCLRGLMLKGGLAQ